MIQILANAGDVTLTKYWYQDGTHVDVGDVTIGIVDGNGTEVVASGTATTNNTTSYTYSLADLGNPQQLTVTWTDVDTTDTRVDRVEVLGGWLFTEAQARAFASKADATSALKPLDSPTEYPDSVIAEERARITDDLERWTGKGWVPRYCRIEMKGNGGSVLQLGDGIARTSDGYALNRPGRYNDIAVVLSVTIGGTAQTVGNYEINPVSGQLINKNSVFTVGTLSDPYNVVVEYVYGVPYTIDGVDRIAMKLLIDRLVPSAFPDRALSVDTDYGTTRFVQPGGPMKNVSRVPEVNEWIRAHNNKILVG